MKKDSRHLITLNRIYERYLTDNYLVTYFVTDHMQVLSLINFKFLQVFEITYIYDGTQCALSSKK